MVSPPSDATQAAAVSAPPSRPAGTGAPPDPQLDTARSVAAAGIDSADIRPLDLAGALQILIAEVRAELTRALLGAIDTPATTEADTRTNTNTNTNTNININININVSANANANADANANFDAVVSAARDILESVMNSLPQSSQEVAAWSGALPLVDAAVELGMARALAIIDSWREVPAPVVTRAQEVRALVASALSDEPLNPIWLRPEGLNLAPRLTRLRRRRKFLQRRQKDPDYRVSFFDDPEPLA
jgi:hypothetical protein